MLASDATYYSPMHTFGHTRGLITRLILRTTTHCSMCCCSYIRLVIDSSSAVDELVADGEVSVIDALPIGVDLAERRGVVHVQPTIAALVHNPHLDRRARRLVRHLCIYIHVYIDCSDKIIYTYILLQTIHNHVSMY